MIPLSTETKARAGNRITILIPARKYIMNLACDLPPELDTTFS